jgi:RNA polymerase sigma-70 factor, ECF subfamily
MTDAPEPNDFKAGLQRGETEALAGLFEMHRERLWKMVRFRMDPRLRNRLSPEDIVQEAYLAAEKRLEHYVRDPFDSPFIWLRMVVHQTLIDEHRRHLGAQVRDAARDVPLRRRRFTQATTASLVLELTAGLTSPSQAAMRHEGAQAAEDAIEHMDALDREVLLLRHFEELTNGETAEELEITPKAASIRYIRALKRLRQILASAPGKGAEPTP